MFIFNVEGSSNILCVRVCACMRVCMGGVPIAY